MPVILKMYSSFQLGKKRFIYSTRCKRIVITMEVDQALIIYLRKEYSSEIPSAAK